MPFPCDWIYPSAETLHELVSILTTVAARPLIVLDRAAMLLVRRAERKYEVGLSSTLPTAFNQRVFGVGRRATEDAVIRRYASTARRWHTDRQGGCDVLDVLQQDRSEFISIVLNGV